ncbi:MAG: sulfite exporter TauE/SafE family protein, partial [Thermoleophilia bacterium]|nr:sulfite exporter TauE/SafE family protein [Thermoleophilia bacterium]
AVAGGLAGMVLGNLRLPLAVSMADTVSAGGGANAAVSGVAALTAAVAHIRAGRVNWRLFAWLAPPSLVGGFAGGLIANAVSGDVLLYAIAAVLLYGAWELFRWRPPPDTAASSSRPGGEPPPIGLTAARDRLVVTAIGLGVGLLGGAVGLILGSLRLPALLRFTAEQPRLLVGTNLAAGVLVGVAGAIGHLTSGKHGFDVALFVIGAISSAPGAWLGARLTGRLSTESLVRAIAVIVLIVAVAMITEAVS